MVSMTFIKLLIMEQTLALAQQLEARLYAQDQHSYLLQAERYSAPGEVAAVLLDAGLIVVATGLSSTAIAALPHPSLEVDTDTTVQDVLLRLQR